MRRQVFETALVLIGGAIAIGCFEHRVIFRAYHYLFAVLPPWSYLIVTISCYSYAGRFVCTSVGRSIYCGWLAGWLVETHPMHESDQWVSDFAL
jgi:hypothetical protein